MSTKTLTCRNCQQPFEHGGTRQKRHCEECYPIMRRKTWRESAERRRRAAGVLNMYERQKKIVERKPPKPKPRKLIPYAGYDRTEMRR